jgi:hypothetical protein
MRLLAVLALALAGCSVSALQLTQKSLTAADEVQVGAQQAFLAWDKDHQHQLVDTGKAAGQDDAAIKGAINAYREKQAKVISAFEALASASTAAKKAVDIAKSGGLDPSDLGAVLGIVFASGIALQKAAAAIGFVVPGLEKLLGAYQPPSAACARPALAWAVA